MVEQKNLTGSEDFTTSSEYIALREFKEKFGLRDDWHEPDEQEVTAKVTGLKFDNAMGTSDHGQEMAIVLYAEGREELRINLAALLALASRDRD